MMETSSTEDWEAYCAEQCENITENLKVIRGRIAEAAVQSGRPADSVTLMAVTKTVDTRFINHAIDNCGVTLIGENRVQEILRKKPELHLDNVDFHLIGHLQTNKVRQVVGEVSTIQSVDSVKVAAEISKRSAEKNVHTDILLEVNIGREEAKSGFLYEAVPDALAEIAQLPAVTVKGFMAVPPICEDVKVLRGYFSQMNQLFIDTKAKKTDNIDVSMLSMGMSADYVPAILEGATLVRVGSAIFGPRIY